MVNSIIDKENDRFYNSIMFRKSYWDTLSFYGDDFKKEALYAIMEYLMDGKIETKDSYIKSMISEIAAQVKKDKSHLMRINERKRKKIPLKQENRYIRKMQAQLGEQKYYYLMGEDNTRYYIVYRAGMHVYAVSNQNGKLYEVCVDNCLREMDEDGYFYMDEYEERIYNIQTDDLGVDISINLTDWYNKINEIERHAENSERVDKPGTTNYFELNY